MFTGDSYVKWNLDNDKLGHGARKITDGWPGYPFDRVDAVLVPPVNVGPSYYRNFAYIFAGDSYVKWNLDNDKLGHGARKITDGWPGYPFDRVDAVLVPPVNVGPSYYHNFAYIFAG